jgi:hypothetical protein
LCRPTRRLPSTILGVVLSGRRSRRALFVLLVASLAPLVAAATAQAAETPQWRGDFDNGNLQQWDQVQDMGADRVVLEKSIVREGTFAARFTVKPGDHWEGLMGGERAEVARGVGEKEGMESYWAWSTYFPKSFRSDHNAGWQMFTQWHSQSNTINAGVSFQVDHERLVVRYTGGPTGAEWKARDLGPLLRGQWTDFIFHVRWSHGADGELDVWRDGRLVAAHAMGPNIASGFGTYVKQGFYRPPESWITTVYEDGMRYGTHIQDVVGPFALRFTGRIQLHQNRFWFHVRSFANATVKVSLDDLAGRVVAVRSVPTNGNGEAWSSVRCGAACDRPAGQLALHAQALVDGSLPASTRETSRTLRWSPPAR